MKVKFEGGKELEKALAALPRSTAKNVGKRALQKAADPIDEMASGMAPVNIGKLERSVVTGTKLTRSQRSKSARMTGAGWRSESKDYVELHVGTALSRGLFMEFGTFKDDPQPFMRPAWDAKKGEALDTIRDALWAEIEKAAARQSRKLAKGLK